MEDSKSKYEEIFKSIARTIYNEVDNMNSWNSGMVVNKNSLLKNKSLIFISNSLLQSTQSLGKMESNGCC